MENTSNVSSSAVAPLSIDTLIREQAARFAQPEVQESTEPKVPAKRGRPALVREPKPTAEEKRLATYAAFEQAIVSHMTQIDNREIVPATASGELSLRGFFPAALPNIAACTKGRKHDLYMEFVKRDEESNAEGAVVATYVPLLGFDMMLAKSQLFRRVCVMYLASLQTEQERTEGQLIEADGKGFNKAAHKDGMAFAILAQGELSVEQDAALTTLLKSYRGQLHTAINS